MIHEFVNDFRGTELASCNSIVIYVPSRANRRVQGIGIQHRPGMRNRNLFSFPFPFPLCATQIFYYFPMEPMFSLSLSLASFSSSLYLYLSSLFFFLSPFLFNRRKKLFAVMSSCKARLIVVTMFLTKLKLLFETRRVRNSDGLSKIDHLSLPAIIEVVFVERIYSTISPRRRIVLVYRVPRYENAVLAAQI